jgi:predicted ATPase
MITIIFGLPGAGKTKLLAHLAGERMTKYARADLSACKREGESWDNGYEI